DMTMPEFLYKCKNDFEFWCNVVLQDLYEAEYGGIKDFHLEWFNFMENNNRVVILAPSGFAKSTLFGIAYPLWLAFTKKNKQIMIISKTLPQSVRLLEILRVTIENNELLQELRPQNADKSWSKQQVRTTTNCRIFVRPYSINVKGERVDYSILDEAASYDRPEIYLDYIVPRLNPKGKIVLISTPESPVDLMARLNKPGLDYIHRTYPAVVMKNGKRVAIWPERFGLEKLDKLKLELGENYYEKNFMCNPKAEEENAIYTYKMIEDCFDKTRRMTFATEGGNIYFGVDLAVSAGPRADYDCFVVVERLENGKIVLLHGEVHKGWSIKSKISRIIELAETYGEKLISIIVDQSNIGQAIIDDLRDSGFPVKAQDFHPTNRNKLLMNLKKVLEEKTLVIPFDQNDANTQVFAHKLALELVKFKEVTTDKTGQRLVASKYISTGSHDDTVMAVAMACIGAAQEKPFVSFIASA
ncbi:MAG: hypothetical protein ABIB43_01680, partial [archaeon]